MIIAYCKNILTLKVTIIEMGGVIFSTFVFDDKYYKELIEKAKD